jgi:hypothetical protein
MGDELSVPLVLYLKEKIENILLLPTNRASLADHPITNEGVDKI